MGLLVGTVAPEFALKDENGDEVTLRPFRGEKNVFLVFYPLDFSPICSRQLPLYSRHSADFESRNTQLLAVSRDSGYTHKVFCDTLG